MTTQNNFEKLLLEYNRGTELQQRALFLRLGEFPRANAHRNDCNCKACREIRIAQDDPSRLYNIRMKASEVEALRELGTTAVRSHLQELLQK